MKNRKKPSLVLTPTKVETTRNQRRKRELLANRDKPVINAKRPGPNKIDPTRTLGLRNALLKEVRRKFALLKGRIVKLVVDQDIFGLESQGTQSNVNDSPVMDRPSFNAFCPTGEGGGVDSSCSPSSSGFKRGAKGQVMMTPKQKNEYRKITEKHGFNSEQEKAFLSQWGTKSGGSSSTTTPTSPSPTATQIIQPPAGVHDSVLKHVKEEAARDKHSGGLDFKQLHDRLTKDHPNLTIEQMHQVVRKLSEENKVKLHEETRAGGILHTPYTIKGDPDGKGGHWTQLGRVTVNNLYPVTFNQDPEGDYWQDVESGFCYNENPNHDAQGRFASAGGVHEVKESDLLPKHGRIIGTAKAVMHLCEKVEEKLGLKSLYQSGRDLAKAVAKERGYSQDHAEKVGKVLGIVDGISRWTGNIPAIHGGLEVGVHAAVHALGHAAEAALASVGGPVTAGMFVAAKVGFYLPVASLAWAAGNLAVGAAKGENPLRTIRQAREKVRQARASKELLKSLGVNSRHQWVWNFDPDQPRDDHGRFVGMGKEEALKEGFLYHGMDSSKFKEYETSEGFEGGGFSSTPIKAYGPKYLAIRQQDLPKPSFSQGGASKTNVQYSFDIPHPNLTPLRSEHDAKIWGQAYAFPHHLTYEADEHGNILRRIKERPTTNTARDLVTELLEKWDSLDLAILHAALDETQGDLAESMRLASTLTVNQEVVLLDISSIRGLDSSPVPRGPIHSPDDVDPILVGPDGYIVDGRHRLAGLKLGGQTKVMAVIGHLPTREYLKLPDPSSSQRDATDIPSTAIPTSNKRDWQFSTDPEQVKRFKDWLRVQLDELLVGKSDRQLWKLFAERGWKRGAARSFDDVSGGKNYARGYAGRDPGGRYRMAEGRMGTERSVSDFYQGGKEQFLHTAFNQPVSQERLEALAERSFTDLENVGVDMAARMGRTLMDGLAQGQSPHDVARDLSDDLDISRSRAETIARTEIIRAHSEGQLDALTNMGVEEVGVQVEWLATADSITCPDCVEREETILPIDEARGLIPFHPNCRCCWVPALPSDLTGNRRRSRNIALNSFCPTGEGGGIDPSCSPGGYAKKVNLSGIVDKDVVTRIHSTLSSLSQEFGLKLDSVTTTDSKNLEEGAGAEMSTFTTANRPGPMRDMKPEDLKYSHHLSLSKEVWQSKSSLKSARDVVDQGFLADSSSTGILRHEFAHALEKEHPESQATIRQVYDSYKNFPAVSLYSGYSSKEMVAEGFAHWKLQGSLEGTGLEKLQSIFESWRKR